MVIQSFDMTSETDIAASAQWTRKLISVLLSNNDPQAFNRLAQCTSQAYALIHSPAGKQAYPMDEVHWLADNTWRTGISFKS